MPRTLLADLHTKIGEQVRVGCWVSVRRDQGKMVFFDLRDRSGTVQAVVLPSEELAIAVAKDVRAEYVLWVEGTVNKRPEKNINPDVQNGNLELQVQAIEIISKAEIPFELGTEVNLDTLLDNRPFTLRSPRERAIFKVQHAIVQGFRQYLDSQGFVEFQAPKLVGGDAEGGAGVFKVEYLHDQTAYLATSPQLYKQMMVGVYERAYATGAQFRAEKHSTSRHLNEISMLDFEMGFIDDHRDVMKMVAETIRHIVWHVGTKCEAELALFGVELPQMPEEVPSLKLREAQKILGISTDEPDLDPEHERAISEWAKKEHGSDFVFITHYPTSKRPFYTYEDEADPGYTKSFDLLFRGVELLSGGQRVHNYEQLVEKIRSKGLDPEKFAFYLQAFKTGLPPHGGVGMGLERLTQKMLGLSNVKEASLFPRDMNRIDTLLSTDKKA